LCKILSHRDQTRIIIYPGKPENAELTKIPIIEPIEENPDEWVCFNIVRDLPYDALTLMENLLDPSHLPYTHHKTVGNRANAGPVELDVIESNRQGFKGFWKEGPRKGTLGSQETIFIAPNLMWHDITSNKSRRSLTVAYATPIRKGECRLFARFPFKFPSKLTSFLMKSTPTWYLHLGQNGVLEDDQIFLHYQERYLEAMGGSENLAKAFYLPTKADRFVMELHQWINLYNGQPFLGEKLSPPLSKEILLERYHSHRKHCASCRGALARIKKVKMAVMVMGAIAWFLLPYLAFFVKSNLILGGSILGAIVVISGITWLKLNNLEKQFYQGREIPPRNFPEKP
jgi:phenylpropionate dioxygenase-like ring-hydroxylating dioxygenase large terminal subunit